MRRREFIAGFGGVMASPIAVRSQQAETVRIDRIEVVRPGVYDIQAGTSKEDQSVSTGHKVAVRVLQELADRHANRCQGRHRDRCGADHRRGPQTQQGANQGCVAISAARTHQSGGENRQN